MSRTIDVRLELLGGRNQGPPVGDLADDLALPGQQLLERAEKKRVIVGEQNSGAPHTTYLIPSSREGACGFLFDSRVRTRFTIQAGRFAGYAESARAARASREAFSTVAWQFACVDRPCP